jgi:hypothetical protein
MTRLRFGWATLALMAAACSANPEAEGPEAEGNFGKAELRPGVGGAKGMAQPDAPDLAECGNVILEEEGARQDHSGLVVNRLEVKADGRFGWNDAEIDRATLVQYLEVVSTMTPSPTLVVSFEADVKPSEQREVSELIGTNLYCRPRGL